MGQALAEDAGGRSFGLGAFEKQGLSGTIRTPGSCDKFRRGVAKIKRSVFQTSVWLEPVNVQLTGRGRRSGSGVISSSAHVYLSVGHRGNGEFDGESGGICRYLRAVPQFGSQICRVVGV